MKYAFSFIILAASMNVLANDPLIPSGGFAKAASALSISINPYIKKTETGGPIGYLSNQVDPMTSTDREEYSNSAFSIFGIARNQVLDQGTKASASAEIRGEIFDMWLSPADFTIEDADITSEIKIECKNGKAVHTSTSQVEGTIVATAPIPSIVITGNKNQTVNAPGLGKFVFNEELVEERNHFKEVQVTPIHFYPEDDDMPEVKIAHVRAKAYCK